MTKTRISRKNLSHKLEIWRFVTEKIFVTFLCSLNIAEVIIYLKVKAAKQHIKTWNDIKIYWNVNTFSKESMNECGLNCTSKRKPDLLLRSMFYMPAWQPSFPLFCCSINFSSMWKQLSKSFLISFSIKSGFLWVHYLNWKTFPFLINVRVDRISESPSKESFGKSFKCLMKHVNSFPTRRTLQPPSDGAHLYQ